MSKCKKERTSANSSTKICANSGIEMVFSGSHWPSEVVWHPCSQSESRPQIYFQPAHLPFGTQKGSFYRGKFAIWPRVLIMIIQTCILMQRVGRCAVGNKSANCSKKIYVKKFRKYPVEKRFLESIILRKAQGLFVSCCCRFNSLSLIHCSIVKLWL